MLSVATPGGKPMSSEPFKGTAGPTIVANSDSRKEPPPWMVEATVVLQAWKHWGLVDELREFRWQRPSKRYVLIDVMLVLLLVAVSNARGLRDFYRQVQGYEEPLATLWGRDRLIKRPGLLGALRALDKACLAQSATLFCPI
jgi:hypothetical protein